MQAVQRIAKVCSYSQLFPFNVELQRGEVENLIAQWEQEFKERAAEEAMDDSDPDAGYFDELLRLLSDLRQSLLCSSKDL